jgi:kynurenine formamidase
MGTSTPRLSAAEVKNLFEKLSNWGRWGKDDQRGALNFITAQKRASAGRLVQSGETVSMALPLATESGPDNPTPVTHVMLYSGPGLAAALDYFAIAPHGMAFTHLDALCHVFWERKMYNGFSSSEVGRWGTRKCGIDVARDGIVSRGVLLDIALLKKVEWMELGERVFPEDLDAAERAHRVRVEEGDVLLVRTGRMARRKKLGAWDCRNEGMAGLDPSCLPWLHERRIAVLGCDGVSDVLPTGYGNELIFPIHVGMLVAMGVHLIDNADLEALGAACARNARYEFMFTMLPLILERGTASPVNPVAIF